jgi:AraC-like DNA-binding protein
MTTIYGAGGLMGEAIPYPTTPQPIRPVERRNWRPWDPPKRPAQMSPAEQRKALRDAAHTLRAMDKRKKASSDAAYNQRRRDERKRGPERIDVDMDTVRRLHDEHWTMKAIAQHVGVSERTLAHRMDEAGLERRDPNVARAKVTRAQLIAAVEEGLTGKEIAERYGARVETVWTRLWRLRKEGAIA